MSLEKLRDWVGKTQTAEDTITAWPVRALTATFDETDPAPREGDPLPPLWHWLFFLDAVPQSRIGPDGHAERGDFLPPVPLPRRMWAGSRFTFDGTPLSIGDRATRRSEIKSIEPKTGSTGSMVFVTVRHAISGARGHAFVEEHDIVYREAPKPGEQPREPKPAPRDATWSKQLAPDPVLLFRYSALTFNGHRIHYDRSYVTEVEGYPGLIVHGPLLAILLLDQIRRERPEARLSAFAFRAFRPVFDTGPFRIAGKGASGGLLLWAEDNGGALAMRAEARLA